MRDYQSVTGQLLGDMVVVHWIVDVLYSGYFIPGVRVKCFTFGMTDVLCDMKLWVVLGIKNTVCVHSAVFYMYKYCVRRGRTSRGIPFQTDFTVHDIELY